MFSLVSLLVVRIHGGRYTVRGDIYGKYVEIEGIRRGRLYIVL